MKRTLAGIILSLSIAVGCATDPVTRAYQTRKTYVQTMTALDQMAVTGALTAPQARMILTIRPVADAAEKALLGATPGTPLYLTLLDAFSGVVDQLVAAKVAAGGK